MRARQAFPLVLAAGCWLGAGSGCSPEYELLGSGEPSASIGGSVAIGGAGNATAGSNSGGVEIVPVEIVPEGGESAVSELEAGGSSGP